MPTETPRRTAQQAAGLALRYTLFCRNLIQAETTLFLPDESASVVVVSCLLLLAHQSSALSLGGSYLPTPSGIASTDYYGMSTASSGNIVAVGAPQCEIFTIMNWINDVSHSSAGETALPTPASFNGNGYVSLYTCTGGNGVCTFAATYTSPSTNNGPSQYYEKACFGASVALTNSGTYLVVGSPTWGYANRP